MPRAINGNYALPNTVNPVETGEFITADWANATLDDIAAALSTSLDREGRGGMLAALRLVAGTVTVPGLAFGAETTTGMYRPGAGVLAFSILGEAIVSVTADEVAVAAPVAVLPATELDHATTLAQLNAVAATVDALAAEDVGINDGSGGTRYTNVQQAINLLLAGQCRSVFDWMTAAQIADVQARTRTLNVTAAVQAAINSGFPIYCPDGDYLVDILRPRTGRGMLFFGAGRGRTVFVERVANTGIWSNPSGIQFAAEVGNFSLQCHASSNAGTGFRVSGWYSSKLRGIEYLSNGTGYWASLFDLSASPELSYGNVIEDLYIREQVGPVIPINFSNNGAGVLYNANACRIVGGAIISNTRMSVAVDASRSINTVIDRLWIENNSNKTTPLGIVQADASAGIFKGQGTLVTGCYLEKQSPYVDYPNPADGGGDDGMVSGCTFSGSWATTTTFYNGAKGNVWIGNDYGGVPINFVGSAGENWVFRHVPTPTAPTITYATGTTGSLSVSSATLRDKTLSGELTYWLTTVWTPASSGANNATTFNLSTPSGFELKSSSITAHLPTFNDVPVPAAVSLAGNQVRVANVQTAATVLSIQITYKKTAAGM